MAAKVMFCIKKITVPAFYFLCIFVKLINKSMILLGFMGPWEIILIVLVVLLLVGGRKIPELMKGVGKGIRSFKEGMEENKNPEEPDSNVDKK